MKYSDWALLATAGWAMFCVIGLLVAVAVLDAARTWVERRAAR